MMKRAYAIGVAVAAAVSVALGSGAVAGSGCPAPVAVAHRGESALIPENTNMAFVSAAKDGSAFVEMDFRWSKDGIPVVIHDSTVDRTTTSSGSVSSFTYSTLSSMNAGSDFNSAYSSARIPSLTNAIKAVKPFTGVNIMAEFKSTPTDAQVNAVAKILSDNGMTNRVFLQSGSGAVLKRIRAIQPSLNLAYVTFSLPTDTVASIQDTTATYWLPAHATLTQEAVDAVHAAGIKVYPYTPDSEADWLRLSEMGVDGILTNRASRYVGWATSRCGVAP